MYRNTFSILSFAFMLLMALWACDSDDDSGNAFDVPYNPDKPLTVTSIGPLEGGLGTRVVVSGSNFGNDTSKVKLYFNNKESLILKLQDNAIYAMVPKQPGKLSTIKVVINEGENENGTPKLREAVLEDQQFRYHIKATVTTVAGQLGVAQAKDGMALEATFHRPVMIACDNSGTVMVADDDNGSVRMLSISDNKVSTVLKGFYSVWQVSFNLDFTKFFALERRAYSRPLLFQCLSKETNWQQGDPYYDQVDDVGNYVFGKNDVYGLAADNEFVYLLAHHGKRLARVNIKTRKVELIGENLNMDSWSHMAYNAKTGYMYITSESWGRLYRFDPRHTPEGRTTPWITQKDVEHVVGMSRGNAKEGNGKSAVLGCIEGAGCDQEGNVYLADYTNHVIWKIDEELNATIHAGVPGSSGYKDGKPKEAKFNREYDVASTADGIVYVADTYNRLVRCIAVQ